MKDSDQQYKKKYATLLNICIEQQKIRNSVESTLGLYETLTSIIDELRKYEDYQEKIEHKSLDFETQQWSDSYETFLKLENGITAGYAFKKMHDGAFYSGEEIGQYQTGKGRYRDSVGRLQLGDFNEDNFVSGVYIKENRVEQGPFADVGLVTGPDGLKIECAPYNFWEITTYRKGYHDQYQQECYSSIQVLISKFLAGDQFNFDEIPTGLINRTFIVKKLSENQDYLRQWLFYARQLWFEEVHISGPGGTGVGYLIAKQPASTTMFIGNFKNYILHEHGVRIMYYRFEKKIQLRAELWNASGFPHSAEWIGQLNDYKKGKQQIEKKIQEQLSWSENLQDKTRQNKHGVLELLEDKNNIIKSFIERLIAEAETAAQAEQR